MLLKLTTVTIFVKYLIRIVTTSNSSNIQNFFHFKFAVNKVLKNSPCKVDFRYIKFATSSFSQIRRNHKQQPHRLRSTTFINKLRYNIYYQTNDIFSPQKNNLFTCQRQFIIWLASNPISVRFLFNQYDKEIKQNIWPYK